jgi:hypothetical protein
MADYRKFNNFPYLNRESFKFFNLKSINRDIRGFDF